MRKTIPMILVLVLAATMIGCSTIVSGARQEVTFTTSPDGATVSIYEEYGSYPIYTGQTPTQVKLHRGGGMYNRTAYRVVYEMDGYEPMTFMIESSLNGGWYIAGNFFMPGGLIGLLIVDPATGAMWKFDKQYHYVMTETEAEADGVLAINLVGDVPEDVMSEAVRIN